MEPHLWLKRYPLHGERAQNRDATGTARSVGQLNLLSYRGFYGRDYLKNIKTANITVALCLYNNKTTTKI